MTSAQAVSAALRCPGMEISAAEYERLMHRSRLMDLAQDILIVTQPNGKILDINGAVEGLHGGRAQDFIGRNVAEFLGADSAADMVRISTAMIRRGKDSSDQMNLVTRRHDGATVYLELRVSWSHSERKFYVVERNVTKQREQLQRLTKLSEDLREQARTDHLTGIRNRAAFDEAMTMLEKADDEGAWLILIDVDLFKGVNDAFGHQMGDQVLIEVAQRIESVLRPEELVARIGGDEFAVLMRQADHFTFQRRLDEIDDRVNAVFSVAEEVDLEVGCSLGAARRRPGDTTATWLRRADRHLYAAKDARPRVA